MSGNEFNNVASPRDSVRRNIASSFLSNISLTPLGTDSPSTQKPSNDLILEQTESVNAEQENIQSRPGANNIQVDVHNLNTPGEASNLDSAMPSSASETKREKSMRLKKIAAAAFLSSIEMDSPSQRRMNSPGTDATSATVSMSEEASPINAMGKASQIEFASGTGSPVLGQKSLERTETRSPSNDKGTPNLRGEEFNAVQDGTGTNATTFSNSPRRKTNSNVIYAELSGKHPETSFIFEAAQRFRLYFVTSQSNQPVLVSSVLKYSAEKKRRKQGLKSKAYPGKLSATTSSSNVAATIPQSGPSTQLSMTMTPDDARRKLDAESYGHLLMPGDSIVYNADMLDDPDLNAGINKSIIALPSYIVSVIPYSKPSELRKELNDQFRQEHPYLDSSISLSKIRNLKTDMLNVGILADLEMSTVAKAYTFFEKLTLKVFVV